MKAEHWSHRLRVMLGFDLKKVRWHKRNCVLEEVARLWKSYLADNAMEKTDSPTGEGLPNRPMQAPPGAQTRGREMS